MVDPLRALVARLVRGPAADRAVSVAERAARWRPGRLAILTYHRVDDPAARPDLMPSLVSATSAAFAEQMAMLVRHYQPVSLADVLDALDTPARIPPRAVLVTFDDAYRDLASNAWPVMRSLGIPATVFVPTAFAADPAVPFWWDRLWAATRASGHREPLASPIGPLDVRTPAARLRTIAKVRTWLKTLDHDEAMAHVDGLVAALGDPGEPSRPAVLGWDELRRLAGEGLAVAPHTRHHPLLERVSLDRAVEEIRGSFDALAREVGTVAPVLAYPSGAHGGTAVEAARRAGVVLAVTTTRGGNDLRSADRLRLRRINVGIRAHAPLVRAELVWAHTLAATR
ncbi:polysaccharide deacetylase family protein [soil metagenome]